MQFKADFTKSLKAIGPGARGFLLFSFFNILAVQCLFGKFLVLYARALGVSAVGTGYLSAILPFSMVLSLFMKPISEQIGPKKLMIYGWLFRNILIMPILMIPWVYHKYGTQAAMSILFTSMLFFCISRALSVVGWFPWQHELLPSYAQGRYMSLQVIAMRGCSIVLGPLIYFFFGPDKTTALWKFMVVNTFGIICGFISIIILAKVPLGGPMIKTDVPKSHIQDYFTVLADDKFRRFLLWGTIGASVTIAQLMLMTLYMRDYLGLSDGINILSVSVGGVVSLLTVQSWGKMADKHGTPIVMAINCGVAGLSVLAISLIYPSNWAAFLMISISAVLTQSCAGFFVASRRGLLQHTKTEHRNTYSAIWLTTTTLCTGTLYLLIGKIVKESQTSSYKIGCIAIAMLLISAGIGSIFVKEDSEKDSEKDLTAVKI